MVYVIITLIVLIILMPVVGYFIYSLMDKYHHPEVRDMNIYARVQRSGRYEK